MSEKIIKCDKRKSSLSCFNCGSGTDEYSFILYKNLLLDNKYEIQLNIDVRKCNKCNKTEAELTYYNLEKCVSDK